MKAQTESIINAVKAAIDSKAWDSGHITSDRFVGILDSFKRDILNEQQQRLDNLREEVRDLAGGTSATVPEERTVYTAGGGCIFFYNGKFFGVPQDFKFPSNVSLKSGIGFWFRGLSVGNEGSYVKPFRELTSKSFATQKLKDEFKLKWLSCFKNLEDSGIMLPRAGQSRAISQTELDRIYNEFVSFLKQRYSYCFTKTPDCITVWSIGTWSFRMSRSQVVKFGSASDKSFFIYLFNQFFILGGIFYVYMEVTHKPTAATIQ